MGIFPRKHGYMFIVLNNYGVMACGIPSALHPSSGIVGNDEITTGTRTVGALDREEEL